MSRSLLHAGAVTVVALGVTLTAPSYAGIYRHHDPAGDMQAQSTSCVDATSACTDAPTATDPTHTIADITRVRVVYRGSRVYVAVRMRSFPRSSGGSLPGGSARAVPERRASPSLGATAGPSNNTVRFVGVALAVPHRRQTAEVEVVHRPNGRLEILPFGVEAGPCPGTRGHLDRSTTTLHLSMPRRCLARAGKVRVATYSGDEQFTDDGTTSFMGAWTDDGLSRSYDGNRLTFSRWIHHD